MAETLTQRAWRRRSPGYYVVDPEMRIAVKGPFRRPEQARVEAGRLNQEQSARAPRLEVRLVGAPSRRREPWS